MSSEDWNHRQSPLLGCEGTSSPFLLHPEITAPAPRKQVLKEADSLEQEVPGAQGGLKVRQRQQAHRLNTKHQAGTSPNPTVVRGLCIAAGLTGPWLLPGMVAKHRLISWGHQKAAGKERADKSALEGTQPINSTSPEGQ